MTRESAGEVSPEGRRLPWFEGWTVIVAAMVIQGFTQGISAFSFSFWVIPWTEEFNSTRGEVMVAMMAMSLTVALLAPFAGRAMDRLPMRSLVAAGVAILALGLYLVSRAQAVWQIVVIYALLIGMSALLTGPMAGQCLASRWFTERRGLALGMVSVGSSLGGLSMPPLVTFLQGEYGWRAAHVILALMSVAVMLPFALAMIRNPHRPVMLKTDGDRGDDSSNGVAVVHWTVRGIVTSLRYWKIILGFLPFIATISLILANLGPFGRDLGISAQYTSYLMSAFAFSMIIGKLAVGTLTDYIDYRRLYLVLSLSIVVAYGILLTGTSFGGLLLACAVLGFGAGSYTSFRAVVVADQFGVAAFGTAVGLVLVAYTGVTFVVPVSGWVRDNVGSYDPVWWAVIIVTLVVMPMMLGLTPERINRNDSSREAV